MYYALVKDGKVVSYPYSVFDFRRDNKNISLPISPTEQQLNEVDMFFVHQSKPPVFNFLTEKIEETTPILEGNKYVQAWSVVSLTTSEIESNMESQWANVRSQRDSLLSSCDWTQLPDVPLDTPTKEAWVLYRQELRDVTSQSDPYNINWPVQPGESIM